MRAPVGPPVLLVLMVLPVVLMVLPVVLMVILVLVVLLMLPRLILFFAFVLVLLAPMPATVVPKAALLSPEGRRLLASEGGRALGLGIGSDSAKEGDQQQREHGLIAPSEVIPLISAT